MVNNNRTVMEGPTIPTQRFDLVKGTQIPLKDLHNPKAIEMLIYKRMNPELELWDIFDKHPTGKDRTFKFAIDDTNFADMVNNGELALPSPSSEAGETPMIKASAGKTKVGTLTQYRLGASFTKEMWNDERSVPIIMDTLNRLSFSFGYLIDTYMFTHLVSYASAPTITLADGTWENNSNKINKDIKNIIKSFNRQMDKTWNYNVTDLYLDWESYDYAEDFYDAYDKKTWNDGNVENIKVSTLRNLNNLEDFEIKHKTITPNSGAGLWLDKTLAPAGFYYHNPNSDINNPNSGYNRLVASSRNVPINNDFIKNPSIVRVNIGYDKDPNLDAANVVVECIGEFGLSITQPLAVGFMDGFLTPSNSNTEEKSNSNTEENNRNSKNKK